MTVTETTPTIDEAAGLKLLTARHRRLHPRGQVQTLVRIARRALARADWYAELAGNYRTTMARPDYADDYTDAERMAHADEVVHLNVDQGPLREKARVATEACLYLNRVHALGYSVPR